MNMILVLITANPLWKIDKRVGDFMPQVVLKTLLFGAFFMFLTSLELLAQFAGGTGKKDDPFQINSWEQLVQVRENASSAFILTGDLDKSSPGYDQYAGANANSGLGWMPISDFTGVFDGDNHRVSDLVIARPSESKIGLFGKAANAQIQNLHLSNFQVQGGNDVGSLLGMGIKVQISNCSFEGQVLGKYYVGGLIGTIGNSEISTSYSLGDVSGFRSAGGIAGNVYQTNLYGSFSSGNVSANLEAGGLVGLFHSYSNNYIQDSYSISRVTAHEVAGGLIGRFSGASLKTSYAAGLVSAGKQVGGLFGVSEAKVSIIDSFWDEERTGQPSNSAGGSGMKTKKLKDKNSLPTGLWDFSEIWAIKEPTKEEPVISYPFLKSIKYDQVGQKEKKNPIPGLESAKIPSGINFPLESIKTYGDPDYPLGEVVDKLGQTIIYSAEDTSIVRITGNQAMILKAGVTKIKAETTNEYHISDLIPLEQTLTVLPAVLKVEVVSGQKKVFGSADPQFDFNLSGLEYGDGPEILSGKLAREVGEAVGMYQITEGNLAAGENYQIEFEPAYFEVTKREVIVESQAKRKIFGNSDPDLTYLVSGIGAEIAQRELSGNLKREIGEAVGKYKIGAGDLKISANYELIFKESFLEITPATLSTVLDPSEIQTPWAAMPILPTHVNALTQDGQILEVPVSWEKTGLNLMEKGACMIAGSLNLPEGITNPDLLKATQKLSVLPKLAPQDILLSNSKFVPGSSKSVSEIGRFKVIDQTDDFHVVTLAEGNLDNSLFLINGNSLVWKNDEKAQIKNQYSILVNVLDRGGNSLQKEFLIKSEFVRLSDIEIFNSFTPNQDGINDTWGISSLGQSEGIRIQIFERSGSLIFSTEKPEDRWDGTHLGKPAVDGTYYWVLNSPKTGETRKGFLNLLRN